MNTSGAKEKRQRMIERAGLLIALALVVFIGISAGNSWVSFCRSSKQAAVALQVVETTNVLLASLTDAETGQRGFLLTGEDRYLVPYKRALNEIYPDLDTLERTQAQSRPMVQVQRVGVLRQLVKDKLDELRQTIELRQSKDLEAALSIVRTDRGKMIMDQIRLVCGEIVANAFSLSGRQREIAVTNANETGLTAVVGSGIILAILGFSTFEIELGTRRRLELIASLAASHNEIRHINAALESRVGKRTEELSKAVGELERFTYTVAHDLRGPLRSIHRYGELLLERSGALPASEAESYLHNVVNAAERLDQLIGDLLTYSQLDMKQLNPEALDPGQIVQDAIGALAVQFEERRAEVNVCGPLPLVLGDRVLLGQILANFLSNALKFVPSDRKPEIKIWATTQGSVVRLWIQDNGIGIEPHYHDRIFKLFERLHSKEEYAGTGVGLGIVKRAAERLGGRVGFDSKPGKGSRFWVELILAKEGT